MNEYPEIKSVKTELIKATEELVDHLNKGKELGIDKLPISPQSYLRKEYSGWFAEYDRLEALRQTKEQHYKRITR